MKIMVCYDGTEPSKRAVRLAREQAKAFNGEVMLVTTLEKGTAAQQEDINAAKEGLEYARSIVAAGDIPCTTDLLIRGLDHGEDLAQFARDRDADLIIIGIVKKSKVGKLFFGSTAQYLILKAPCPVLTVK
jgi:nucleotide-binding universal stress UspA family protein